MKASFRVVVRRNEFGQIADRTRGAIAEALNRAAFAVEGQSKINLVTQGAVDTGNLLNSIGVIDKATSATLVAVIGTSVEYAPHVEFGTYKMRARPYLAPAVEHVQPMLQAAIREAVGW